MGIWIQSLEVPFCIWARFLPPGWWNQPFFALNQPFRILQKAVIKIMMQQKIIVTLDGHSSCGKSTYAKKIAEELGYAYIDTGSMYRAVTLASMEAGLFNLTDSPRLELVENLLGGIELSLRYNSLKRRTEIFLNERMVEDMIRGMDVSGNVSYVATISAVRRKMVEY